MDTRASVRQPALLFRNLVLTLMVGALLTGCGNEPSRAPTAPLVPAPTPAPNPTTVGGNGTFASSNWSFSPFAITVQLEVSGNSVKGTWRDVPWWDMEGDIVGTLDGTSFAGTVSLNHCKAEFRGTLTDTSATWTSPGVNEPCTIFAMTPNPVAITLQFSR